MAHRSLVNMSDFTLSCSLARHFLCFNSLAALSEITQLSSPVPLTSALQFHLCIHTSNNPLLFCFITARNLHHSSILTVDYYCHVETAPWAVVKTPLTKLPVMLIQALINRGMYNGIQNVPWYFLASEKKEQVIRKQQKWQCFTLQWSTGS